MLPVIGGACRVCHNMPVSDGYVGNHPVEVLRDSGCSGVVVKHSLVSQDQLTGRNVECVLIDGTVRKVPEAYINIHTPFISGKVKALCMNNPVYGLIIGNIDGARDPSDPDPKWDTRRNNNEVVEIDTQELVVGSAVQTRNQVQKEKEKYKTLKVTSITDNFTSVDDMRVAQSEDATLDKYREYARTGVRKFTGQQNLSWFVIEDDLLFRYFQSPKVTQLEMV
ncbi:uncharacterized protein LOC133189898 [Saccostrea echinata]|uniref:uncharacterized protein LOC133189898 n=1 Tax=Saccostrea echinata TaxID=191078 RepID=UPI002A7F1B32|nr:uncharacterized protein LOC133189898 [Saccostrea echinata]